MESKKKGRRLLEPAAKEIASEGKDAFEINQKLKAQLNFREREVDNLQNLIYGNEGQNDWASEETIDSNRFTAPKVKLELFKRKAMKKLVKKRFVTG